VKKVKQPSQKQIETIVNDYNTEDSKSIINRNKYLLNLYSRLSDISKAEEYTDRLKMNIEFISPVIDMLKEYNQTPFESNKYVKVMELMTEFVTEVDLIVFRDLNRAVHDPLSSELTDVANMLNTCYPNFNEFAGK